MAPGPFDLALGTIGGGNHFAELQQVERVEEPEAFRQMGLEADGLALLVHRGSRGLGEALLRSQAERHGAGGLAEIIIDACMSVQGARSRFARIGL